MVAAAAQAQHTALIVGLAREVEGEFRTGKDGEGEVLAETEAVVEQHGDVQADDGGGVLAADDAPKTAGTALGAVAQLAADVEFEVAGEGQIVVGTNKDAAQGEGTVLRGPCFGTVTQMNARLGVGLASKENAGKKDSNDDKSLLFFVFKLLFFRSITERFRRLLHR